MGSKFPDGRRICCTVDGEMFGLRNAAARVYRANNRDASQALISLLSVRVKANVSYRELHNVCCLPRDC
jgi:hypothetical protein